MKKNTLPIILFLAAFAVFIYNSQVGVISPGSEIEVGERFNISSDFRDFSVSVPAGEAASVGTTIVEFPATGEFPAQRFALERDGTVFAPYQFYGESAGLVLFTKSAGSGSYGSLQYLKYTDSGVELALIPEPTLDQLEGTMGHDRLWAASGNLIRRWPVYKDGDSNSSPNGGERRMRYNWANASWKVLDAELKD